MSEALESRVTETSKKINLSKQDTMRLSLERGLGILLAQLLPESEAGADAQGQIVWPRENAKTLGRARA